MTSAELIAGRYQVLAALGSGGAADVFRVRDLQDRSEKALKRLKAGALADPVALARAFHHEFQTLTELRHPHLVRVHDFGASRFDDGDRELPWFTMDLVDGRPIDTVFQGAPDPVVFARLVDGVLDALTALHDRGLVHGDVSCSNILVGTPLDRDPPPVWLMDLGLVGRTRQTDGSVIRGTLASLAPESLRGGAIDGRADLYSLGCVMYRVVTGQDPFTAATPWELIRAHLSTPPVPPRHLNPDIPVSLEAVILSLLAKDPADRPSTAHAVRQALSALSGRALGQVVPLREPLAPSLAGRERELGLMQESLDTLRSGHGGTTLLMAAPGLGRTRLLEEYLLRARLTGIASAMVRVTEAPQRPLGVVDTLLAAIAAARDERERPLEGGRLERLFALLAARPTALFVDDMQAADAASKDVLQQVAERTGDGSLATLLILSLSESSNEIPDPLADALLERGLARVVRLRPLDAAATGRMAASMLGRSSLPHDWEPALHRKTSGVPLLVEELMATLVASGRVGPGAEPPADAAALLEGVTPASRRSRAWLDQQWQAGSPSAHALLAALAVAGGQPVSFLELEQMDPRAAQDPAAVDAILRMGLATRLTDGQGHLALQLAVPSMAPLILERSPKAVVVTLHRRRAETLSAVPDSETMRARHWLAAGEVLLARELLSQAAAGALAAGTPREAARLADEALAMGRGTKDLREGPLRRIRAAALAAAGHVGEAEAEFSRAIETCRVEGDALELAEALSQAGVFQRERGSAEKALADLEQALALLDDLADVAGGARVLLELGRLLDILGRSNESEARLTSALSQARRAGRPDLEADALVALGERAARLGRSEEASDNFRAAEQAAGRVGAHSTRRAARRGKVLALETAGRVTEALHEAEKLLEEARGANHRDAEAEALALCARLAARSGQRSIALRALDEALSVRRRLGQPAECATLLGQSARLLAQRGQPRAAWARAQEARALAQTSGSAPAQAEVRRALGRVEAELGRVEAVEELLPAALDASPAPLERAERLLSIGIARLVAGRPDDARGPLQEACFVARRSDLPDIEAEGLLRLAESYLDLKDDERALLALKRVRQAAETRQVDEIAAHARLLGAERELSLASGDAALARDEAEFAIRVLTERERGDLVWRAHAAHALALRRLGELAGAQKAGREAFRLVDGILAALPAADRERWRRASRVRALLESVPAIASDLTAVAPAASSASESERVAELERLLELNRALNSTLDLATVLQHLIDTAIDVAGAERGFVLVEEAGRTATELARGEGGSDLSGADREHSRGVARRVMRDGAPLLAFDAQTDERLSASRSIQALQIQSVLAVPLRVRGQNAGAIVLDSRRATGMFDAHDQELLTRLADQAGIALANAHQVAELKRQAEEIERLNVKLRQEVEQQRIEILEKQSNLEVRYRYDSLIGASPPMQKLYRSLDKIVPTEIPVMVLGESGTGKDLAARVLHYNGPRAKERFVTVNCAALTDTLLESELFGHRRGAFTGAERDRGGLFEQADRGTLFLDEIGEMPLSLQPKLLRAIQFGEVRRVGDDTPRHVDVRVVAATHRNLAELVRSGKFREDLLYRLDVARVELAPLRERLEDLGLLIDHFFEVAAEKSKAPPKRIEPAALKLFLRYHWPGNVRELEHEIIKLAAFTPGDVITEVDVLENASFLERARQSGGARVESPEDASVTTLEQAEIEQIRQALRTAGGNRTRAAEMLGIDRSTLYRKLRRLGEE